MVNKELQEIILSNRMKAADERVRIHTPDARRALMCGLVYYCGEQTQWLPEYESIALWLANNNGRGLLCYGNCGRGKSLITQKILPRIFLQTHRLVMNTIAATNLSTCYKEISNYKIISVDDIGTEDVAYQYGEKHDYFREIVDLAERKQKLLLVTTNLSLSEIKQRYGERTIDRLHAITTTVLFKGESLRR